MEKHEQIAFVQWFKYQYPNLPIIHNPNENIVPQKYRYAYLNHLKKMGLMKGVADILIPVSNKKYRLLWIEFKWGKNKQTNDQKEFENKMKALGDAYFVCYTWNQAKEIVKDYFEN